MKPGELRQAQVAIAAAKTKVELEQLRVKYLGRKSAVAEALSRVGQLPQGAEGQSLEEAVENAERLLKELMDMQADGLTVRKYATGRNETQVCVVTIDPAIAEKRQMVAVAEWAGDPKSSKHGRKWFVD